MIDPVGFEEVFQKTSSLLVPTPRPTPSVSPIPSVLPDLPYYEKVTHAGSQTLWVVFVIMLLSTIAFTVLAWRVPVQKRVFHVITALITTFATISYFAMATGDGISFTHIVVKEAHKHVPDTVEHVFRQVFWARYVDWALTTPLLLLDLAFLAGMDGASILVAVVADVIMILLGLFASVARHNGQKWGYFSMAIIAFVVILYQLIVSGRRAAMSKNNSTAKLFAAIGGFTIIVWTLYPIVWALGEGTRVFTVDSEIIAYAVLDVLAKPVFGFWLLFAHGKHAASVEGFWSHGLSSEGVLRVGDDE